MSRTRAIQFRNAWACRLFRTVVVLLLLALAGDASAYNFSHFGGRLGRPGVDDFSFSWDIPDNGTILWWLDRGELDVADCDATCFNDLKALIQPELDKWALWIRVNIAEAPNEASAHVIIRFMAGPAGADANSLTNTGGTLDTARIRINPAYDDWTTNAGKRAMRFFSLHEFGHCLGVGDLYSVDHNGTTVAGGVFEGEDFVDHGLPSGGLPDTRTKNDNPMQTWVFALDNDSIHAAEWLWGAAGSSGIVTGELKARAAGFNANEADKHHGLTQTAKTWTYRGTVAAFTGNPKVTLKFKGIQDARDVGPGAWTPTIFPDRVEFDHAGAWEGNFKFQLDCNQPPERFGDAIVKGAVTTAFTATPAGGGRQSFPFAKVYGADCKAPACLGDTDFSGVVDVTDLVDVILNWGSYHLDCPPFRKGDTDRDCDVDVDDLLNVIIGWGNCPQVTGVCCFMDASCNDQLSDTDCLAQGGTWFGTDTLCSELVCEPETVCDGTGEVLIGGELPFTSTTVGQPAYPHPAFGEFEHVFSPTAWVTVIGDGTELTASICGPGTGPWNHQMAVYCGNCQDPTCITRYAQPCLIPEVDDGDIIIVPSGMTWCSVAGEPYLIAIFGSDDEQAGTFSLTVTSSFEQCVSFDFCRPPLICLAATVEQEPCLEDWDGITPVVDIHNGGCSSCGTPLLDTLVCNERFCGSISTFISAADLDCDDRLDLDEHGALIEYELRDTDWFELVIPDLGNGGAALRMLFASEYPGICGILPPGCEDPLLSDYVLSSQSQEVELLIPWLESGEYQVFIASQQVFDAFCSEFGGVNYYVLPICEPGGPADDWEY